VYVRYAIVKQVCIARTFPPSSYRAAPKCIAQRLIPPSLRHAHAQLGLSNDASKSSMSATTSFVPFPMLMRLGLVSLLPARRSQLELARQGSRLLHLFRVPGRHKLSRDMKPLQKVLRPTEVSDVTDGTVEPMFILGAGSHELILLLCQRTGSVAKWCNLNLKVCA
jgi:hypothetical protein